MPLPIIAAALGPVLSATIMALLRRWAIPVIGKILATIGIGMFTYNYAVPEINSFIASKFHALPSFIRESVGASGIDVFVTMVVSALAVRAVSSVFMGKRAT